MIVDTSALVAVLRGEHGWQELNAALVDETGVVPAPVLTEFYLVAAGSGEDRASQARRLIGDLIEDGLQVCDYTERHALLSCEARERYGRGNGRGGKLNLLDLMVYAVAKERGEPLLCTGKDYAATDLALHASSRPW